jgi:hypothetical protein
MKKQKKKSRRENIIIPRKSFLAMMCIVPLTAIIISKKEVGTLIVLMVGVAAGIFIGKGYFEK